MSQLTDISVIELQKENIQPLVAGRSIGNLVKGLKESSKSGLQFKQQLAKDRQQFEARLTNWEELDDPLNVFIQYIDWIHANYPQGVNSESGLVPLLERCTSCFRDVSHYKNDPRYLKVWLEYAKYSDSPRDIFVYLSKKGIGNQLAIYYEQFATYLHNHGNWHDADQIFKLGIENNARPLSRLQRNYHNFTRHRHIEDNNNHSSISKLNPLALKRGSLVVNDTIDPDSQLKKRKFEIFQDHSTKSILDSLNDPSDDVDIFGSLLNRAKENTIKPTQWSGEILVQKSLTPTPQIKPKIQVYQDLAEVDIEKYNEIDSNGQTYTVIQAIGKKTENIRVNMDLLYPSPGQEFCLIEILALSRGLDKRNLQNQILDEGQENLPQIYNGNPRLKDFQQEDLQSDKIDHFDEKVTERYKETETNETFTIQLNDNDTIFNKTRSPTITAYSKFANREVINMFNAAAHDFNSDDEEERNENITNTNFSGFVTETLHSNNNHLEYEKTPPTDKEDNATENSTIGDHVDISDQLLIVNALDLDLREKQLANLPIPLHVYPGYHNYPDKDINHLNHFKNLFINKKSIPNGSQSAMIDFCGNEIFCIRNQLGEGGFGVVFLVESSTKGNFKALKVESPGSKWEFYILNQIHRRLIGSCFKKFFIKPDSLYIFQNESYLFIEYCPQFTLLDLINYYKDNYNGMEEVLCIYITLQLIKAVSALHSINILHCDLKADNCMINFDDLDENENLEETYNRDGLNGWSRKSIKLIDFGRAIDLSLFKKNVKFKSCWKTDEHDCPQMQDNCPWSYEADYFGLAGIIHTLLFGTYIKIKRDNGTIHLETPLKRYWQNEIWNPLFNLLLNPYENENSSNLPLIGELEFQAVKLERWLEANSHSKNLKQILVSTEYELNIRRKKLEG